MSTLWVKLIYGLEAVACVLREQMKRGIKKALGPADLVITDRGAKRASKKVEQSRTAPADRVGRLRFLGSTDSGGEVNADPASVSIGGVLELCLCYLAHCLALLVC
tara:strand:+ start:685 stop:1002 length:318 start_codon:yes stop_codon:yes gene_type:complete